MILPERVFGRSGVNSSMPGRANLPISVATWPSSSWRSSSDSSTPSRGITKTAICSPLTGSAAPMAAASATAGCDTSADSTSVVEMRWPETLMTSSTRPISQKSPSSSVFAPSPVK